MGVIRTHSLDTNTGEVIRSEEPLQLHVLASHYPQERRSWVVLTTEYRGVEVSAKTAVEPHDALGKLIKQITAG